jgi:hypothetical protein
MRFLLLLSLVVGIVCGLFLASREPAPDVDPCAYQTADGFYLTVPSCASIVYVDPALAYGMWR